MQNLRCLFTSWKVKKSNKTEKKDKQCEKKNKAKKKNKFQFIKKNKSPHISSKTHSLPEKIHCQGIGDSSSDESKHEIEFNISLIDDTSATRESSLSQSTDDIQQ